MSQESPLEPLHEAPAEPPAGDLHRDEGGQLSIFFAFSMLALVLLFGVLFNTANQTTRKVEMQGAADAAAIAGGAMVARGMNLIALNNNGMADILGFMVLIHSYRMTLAYGNIIITAIYEALIAGTFTAAIGAAWKAEWQILYNLWYNVMSAADDFLSGDSGVGWKIMTVLDYVNQVLVIAIPQAVGGSVVQYAQANGAANAILVPRETTNDFSDRTPTLPLDRPEGSHVRIALRADHCPYDMLSSLIEVNPIFMGVMSFPIMASLFQIMSIVNWNSLQGNEDSEGVDTSSVANQAVDQIIEQVRDNPQLAVDYFHDDWDSGGFRTQAFLAAHPEIASQVPGGLSNDEFRDWFSNYLLTHPDDAATYVRETRGEELREDLEDDIDDAQEDVEQEQEESEDEGGGGGGDWQPLEWPDDPARPMILDAKPDDDDETDENIDNVAKYLQYLSAAYAPKATAGLIGANNMRNRAPYGWLMYSQANVYNPSLNAEGAGQAMFVQDWRVKLVRAHILDEKWETLADEANAEFGTNLSNDSDSDGWEYVNLH
jgi:hypothetical protein